jgi:undecaprenyl-diphosphatase
MQTYTFDIVVHGATVLSTLVVFRKDIIALFAGLFKFQWNEPTRYIAMLVVSAIPVAIVGFLFEEQIEALFSGNLVFIGSMLLITATLLSVAYFIKKRNREIGFLDAIIIGIAQVFAIIPGISRSGATIATGLIIGNKKDGLAKFSFLMVIIPILGANFINLFKGDLTAQGAIEALPLIAGFLCCICVGFAGLPFNGEHCAQR